MTSIPAPEELVDTTPTLRPALVGLTGLAVLGGIGGLAALGAGTPLQHAAAHLPALPTVFLGTLAISAPALLAAGPTFELEITPSEGVGAMAAGLTRSGQLAWGFVPFMLFTVATFDVAYLFFLPLAAFIGIGGLSAIWRKLLAAEARPDTLRALSDIAGARSVLTGWVVLAGLVGARLLVLRLLGL